MAFSLEVKKIFLKRPDIEKKVWEKYPYMQSEKKCINDREDMRRLREHLAKKLYDNPES